MDNTQIKILRPFFYDGKTAKAGAVVSVPPGFAREMIAAGKAEFAAAKKAAKKAAVVDPVD